MIRQNHTLHIHLRWNLDFEWVSLLMFGYRAKDSKPRCMIIAFIGQNQGWSFSLLLMARLRIKTEQDNIPTAGRIGLYHTSFPTGDPKSTSW